MTRGSNPKEVIFSDAEAAALSDVGKRHNTPQQIALRSRIIQWASLEMNNQQISQELGWWRSSVAWSKVFLSGKSDVLK